MTELKINIEQLFIDNVLVNSMLNGSLRSSDLNKKHKFNSTLEKF